LKEQVNFLVSTSVFVENFTIIFRNPSSDFDCVH
jgi:hypothetical protein